MINYISKSSAGADVAKLSNASKAYYKPLEFKHRLVLKWLLKGKKITAKDAADELNIFCLPQIISYLRHVKKISVTTTIVKYIDGNGELARYAEYSICNEQITQIIAKGIM